VTRGTVAPVACPVRSAGPVAGSGNCRPSPRRRGDSRARRVGAVSWMRGRSARPYLYEPRLAPRRPVRTPRWRRGSPSRPGGLRPATSPGSSPACGPSRSLPWRPGFRLAPRTVTLRTRRLVPFRRRLVPAASQLGTSPPWGFSPTRRLSFPDIEGVPARFHAGAWLLVTGAGLLASSPFRLSRHRREAVRQARRVRGICRAALSHPGLRECPVRKARGPPQRIAVEHPGTPFVPAAAAWNLEMRPDEVGWNPPRDGHGTLRWSGRNPDRHRPPAGRNPQMGGRAADA
jgi:hypothetical protein